MDATAAPTTGSLLPRAVLTLSMLLLSLSQLPSQPKQSLPTPCIKVEQGGSLLPLGWNASSTDHFYKIGTSFCAIRTLVNPLHRYSYQFTLQVSLVFTWAITYQSLPSVGCGANALFVARLHWAEGKVLWHSAPLAASSSPSLGGEGFQKKKKMCEKKKIIIKNIYTTWRAGYLRPPSVSSRPLLG